jgi:hypothetical protein
MNRRQHAVYFFDQLSVFLLLAVAVSKAHCGRSDSSGGPIPAVLVCYGLSLLYLAGVLFPLFQQHVSVVTNVSARWDKSMGVPSGDRSTLLDVISNVFYTDSDSNMHVENRDLEFGRSTNGVTPSRYMIVVLQISILPRTFSPWIALNVSGMHDNPYSSPLSWSSISSSSSTLSISMMRPTSAWLRINSFAPAYTILSSLLQVTGR